jgi:hypothetical protein
MRLPAGKAVIKNEEADMLVIIDGKEIEVKNDVRIIYDVYLKGEKEGSLAVVANYEGVVFDLFDESGENCLETEAIMAQDKAIELEQGSDFNEEEA